VHGKRRGRMNYERRTMTDQTRWGIDLVQQRNKQKAFEQQKEMREEIKKYISDCSVFHLHKMYDEMKRLQDR
jgi:hypothetical protein